MSDLTTYLRRTDVEGMIQAKVDACAQKIDGWRAEFDKLPEQQRYTEHHPVALPLARRIADMEARKSALCAALAAVKLCQQFTLHEGREPNEADLTEPRDAAGDTSDPVPGAAATSSDPSAVKSVVCVNAFHTAENGDVTYSGEGDPIEGWSVYRRIPDPRGNHYPFDTADDDEFPSRELALKRADELGALHGGLEIREY
ncbi:hypothetical protein [Sphingomonas sp. 3-13AW]|uniref:hypothetical protein n=1 Tax=Sphingomonas sp. 3-13AW TaxID=3050450 RepID=UPI003BB6D37F